MVALIAGAAYSAVGIVVSDSTPAAEAVAADPTGGYLSGVGLAQLVAIVLGVIAVTGEYRSTMIRSSMAAVPTRVPLVWGKAAVAATVTTVVALAALLPAFLVARAIVAIADVSLCLTSPGLAATMIGPAAGARDHRRLGGGLRLAGAQHRGRPLRVARRPLPPPQPGRLPAPDRQADRSARSSRATPSTPRLGPRRSTAPCPPGSVSSSTPATP